MRFRRKLLLTLGITTFVTAGLCLGVMERVAHDQMFDAYRAKLLSIAATTVFKPTVSPYIIGPPR